MTVAYYLADQNPHRDRSLGITRVSQEIAHRIHGDVALVEVVSRSSVTLAEGEAAGRRTLPFRTDAPLGRLAADLGGPLVARPDADVWMFPKGYVTSPLPLGAPSLALVHDTILDHYATHHPGERSRLAYAFWLGQLRATLRRATRVVTTSETARRQIEAYCQAQDLRCPPIDTVGMVPSLPTAAPTRAASPFALHVGSDAPHKRTAWLVAQWARLVAGGRDLPPLHVVGTLSPPLRARVEALPGGVVHGHVTDAELSALYQQAGVVVVPSEIEGFGLAALEAYVSGTPAVVTAGTSLEEITRAGTHRGAFAADDPAALADAVDDVLTMSADEIGRVQQALLATYTPARLRTGVLAALQATADA